MIKAPWTTKQIKNLIERQNAKTLHPYTCKCSAHLVPMADGWFCIECNKIVQNWAHTSDVTGEFKKLETFRKNLNQEIDDMLSKEDW